MQWIGIDLGATKMQAVVLDDQQVTAEARRKTPTRGGPLDVVDALAGVVAELSVADPAGVGVGVPGVVDQDTGAVRRAPNLPGWHEPFDLASALREALGGLPVTVDNDVNAGLVAEHRLGSAHGVDDVLAAFVGSGVGGALVQDGRVRRGAAGLAGEIGHVAIDRKGRSCACGGRGHVEAYAGRVAMERRARTLDDKGRPTLLVELARSKRMTSSVFAKALAAGDDVAVELLDEAVTALGVGLASAVALLDVAMVVVGGGLADRLGPSFVATVDRAIRKELFVADRDLVVVGAALGDRGGAIGAALVAADAAGTTT